MKLNQLHISPVREGLNLLKASPSYWLGTHWTRPVSVNFLITSRCNSKCVTCDSWKLTDHGSELTLDEFKRLAGEIAEMRIPIVTLGGGEPTVRKDIWEIVGAFKAEGLSVQLTTNALTLRDAQRDKMFESGLDRVTVSVDSHIPELYKKIRGVDGARQVLDAIEAILEAKPAHVSIDTNTVLCKDNADTFLETLAHLVSLGLPKVNFSAVTTSQNNYLMTDTKAHLSEIPLETVDRVIEGLLALKKRTHAISASTAFIHGLRTYYENPSRLVYPCLAGYLTFDIFQNGSVHGCGNLPEFANVRQGSLSDIWKSRAAELNRRNMAQGKCPNCYLSCKIELAIAANPRHTFSFAYERVFA